MAENRRRGSATPDKEAMEALGGSAPSRLRKAAPSDVVSDLAGQPARVATPKTAAAPVKADKVKTASKKTSFYQQEEDADRMRAAYLNTQINTGYRSLSEFINAAVDEKVSALEKAYNHGKQWPPLRAREIPQGKPMGS